MCKLDSKMLQSWQRAIILTALRSRTFSGHTPDFSSTHSMNILIIHKNRENPTIPIIIVDKKMHE